MISYYPPLSRNDAIKRFAREIVLHIPIGDDLDQFICEEQCPETETPEETVTRLLRERMALSNQGY
jgi:hypothetical protein